MMRNRFISDEIRFTRGRLMDAMDNCIDVPGAHVLLQEARFSLGLLLEWMNEPENPYAKVHNARKRGENYFIPETDTPVFPHQWPNAKVERLEEVRTYLNDVARKMHSSLYLAAGSLNLNHGVDFIARAWQDTLLARCYVSQALVAEAEKEYPSEQEEVQNGQ